MSEIEKILEQNMEEYESARRRAKKLVKVMTPIPPIWIRNMMMICPVCVNVVATSTVVSPVTQTEVVEMNRASTK